MTPAPRTALYEARAAIAAEAKSCERDVLRALAVTYERRPNMYMPAHLVETDDAASTWAIIRHLARKLRAAKRDAWWTAAGAVGTLRHLITCELHVWRRQKDKERTAP